MSEPTGSKYRVWQTAVGTYKIGLNGGVETATADTLWVRACDNEFHTLPDAVAAISRLVASRKWYYDEDGVELPVV